MDIVTYALAKKMASSVASGITEIETNGTNIRFKTSSGDWFSVTLNSINEVSVSANGHLIVKLSDGTQIDCGALPVGTMDTALSATSENGVQNKVITNALNGKQNILTAGTGVTIDTTDPSRPQISANIDYANLINKPTKLSDFTNDENFITNTANNLSNYYLKTETYTQSEVNDLISQLASLSVEIVESLPTTDISTATIYLINVSGTNNYNQWMYINNTWSNIGSTSVDLTNYYTKTQTDTLLNNKVDKVSGKGLSTNDFTNTYKSVLDNYTVDSTLNSTSTNPIQNAVVTQALDAKQPKTLSSPITIGGTSQTTVESALGGLNSLCGTKLTMVTSLPLAPSNQETVLYIGNSSGGLLCGGIYQYQVSEWVMISNVSSFTFNSDEFAVDSTTNEVSLKPSYADIPSFLPNNVSSSNKLATNSNITAITNLIPSDASASNKLVTQNNLADKQDFRIFNSLEEFNEKKGTSLTVVSDVDNMKDIANAMSNGEILIITTRYKLGSEVYFGLTTSTGWTKMFTFIKSNGLCDVECRTTFPLTLKRVLSSDGVVGDWQEIATMDKVGTTQIIGFKTNLLNQCYGYYTIGNNKVSVHMKFVLSRALDDWESLINVNLPAPSSAVIENANGKTGAPNSVYINTDGSMQQGGGGGMSAGTYEFDFEYTTA